MARISSFLFRLSTLNSIFLSALLFIQRFYTFSFLVASGTFGLIL